ncbi:MAG: hypothetical protein ACRD2X_22140 [Vicinamibacteraceae bacterium]
MSNVDTLAKAFTDAHAKDYQAHADHVAAVLGDAKSLGKDFREIWPKAKPVLTSVSAFIRFIPCLGTAAPALTGLVAVGDAINNALSGS